MSRKKALALLLAVVSVYALAHQFGLLSFLFYPNAESVRNSLADDLAQSGIGEVQIEDVFVYEGKANISLSYSGHLIEIWTNIYDWYPTEDTGISISKFDELRIRCWDSERRQGASDLELSDFGAEVAIQDSKSVASILLSLDRIEQQVERISQSNGPTRIREGLWCEASRLSAGDSRS